MKGVWGIYRGVVTDAKDPAKHGRLKARVPDVLGDAETPWANSCVPKANQSAATFKLPPPGTQVWIQFEGGDTDMPVWVGFPLK
jgi:hypothetical protein